MIISFSGLDGAGKTTQIKKTIRIQSYEPFPNSLKIIMNFYFLKGGK